MSASAQENRSPVDLLEVRLLGPLQVLRRDGSPIDNRAWRTGKTLDLLRLLALQAGSPVTVSFLIDALWPNVDATRGRASLRTAASQLRRVIGGESIDRQLDSLILLDAWVDVVAYSGHAKEAHRLLRSGEHAAALAATRTAEALHIGEITAHDQDAEWVQRARRQHASVRTRLLLDAARAALDVGWFRDAVDLAGRVIEAEPLTEEASRVLMSAYAAMGSVERAFREFERCRRLLVDELGVDPSPQTRDLHISLLSGPPPSAPPLPPFIGRQREADELCQFASTAEDSARPDGRVSVMRLEGDTDVERLRLVTDLCNEKHFRLLRLLTASHGRKGHLSLSDELRARLSSSSPRDRGNPGGRAHRPVLVLVEGSDALPDALVADLLAAAGEHPEPVMFVLSADAAGTRFGSAHEPAESTWAELASGHGVFLRPLLREELGQLAQEVIGDRASPALLDTLREQSRGSAGQAISALRRWRGEGLLVSTGQGMVLLDRAQTHEDNAAHNAVARAFPLLSARDLEVLHLVAILDRPVDPELMAALVELGPEGPIFSKQDAESVLGRLVDFGLVRGTHGLYEPLNPVLSDAIRSRLRLKVRRRLHEQVAESGLLPYGELTEHWLAAGEKELACAAAMDAVSAALRAGRQEEARTYLLRVCSLADVEAPLLEDGADLAEQFAAVSRALGREEDAAAAAKVAANPRASGLRELARRVTTPERASSGGVPLDGAVVADRRQHVATDLSQPERRGAWQASQIPASAFPALAAPGGPLPDLSVLLRELVLGRAAWVAADIQTLAADPPADADPPLRAVLALLAALSDHETGTQRDEADRVTGRDSAQQLIEDARVAGPEWAWLPVRVLTEQWRLAEAAAADLTAHEPVGELAHQLDLLARAVLRTAEGHPADAVTILRTLLDRCLHTGCTVLLPEVAVRLALLESDLDKEAAPVTFELFEWALGAEEAGPRAESLRLLARAAIRSSHGAPARAAGAAALAAQIAEASGLAVTAASCHLARADYLFDASHGDAQAALGTARAAYAAAGVTGEGLDAAFRRAQARTQAQAPSAGVIYLTQKRGPGHHRPAAPRVITLNSPDAAMAEASATSD